MFKKSNKIVRSLVLTSLLASTSLAVLSPINTEATPVQPEIVEKVNTTTPTTITSGIEYTDINGQIQKLEIPSNVAVELNANSKRLIVKVGKETKYLDNVKDVTIKNITVSNAVAFHYLTTAEKVTFENVNFQKGVDFGGLKNVKELIVKGSNFGEYCGYSLAIHDAPKLETLIVADSLMESDFRIYCNKSLAVGYVYDSQIDGHAKQHTNKKGYTTDYHNTTFKRSGNLKKVYTDGTNLNSAFNINLAHGETMANTKFDASTDGKISYVNASGAEEEIIVPAHAYIKYIDDTSDRIRIKLSDNRQFYIDNPRELTFRNVEFKTPMEFTHKNLRIEKIEIINSKIWNVQVWNSETLQSLKVSGTEEGHPCTLVKAYNNKVQDTFSIQDSKLVDVKAMNLPNVKDDIQLNVAGEKTNETGFSIYSSYTHGYVYTTNIGDYSYELPVYNTRFNYYIASTNTIKGEDAIRKTVGNAPVLQVQDFNGDKLSFSESTVLSLAKAFDKEDGELTSEIKIESSNVDAGIGGDYEMILSVTDSDGNTTKEKVKVILD